MTAKHPTGMTGRTYLERGHPVTVTIAYSARCAPDITHRGSTSAGRAGARQPDPATSPSAAPTAPSSSGLSAA